MKVLITGGAGFIGSHFVRYFLEHHPADSIINLDKLTYAGNLDNLAGLESNPRHKFIRGDITDPVLVDRLAGEVEAIIHFAAETHVDRSILHPGDFIRTNVYGTYTLLEAARKHRHSRFLHFSTDEVYGSCLEGSLKEDAPLSPSSPYSASKAGADLLVSSYHKTYGFPAIIARCSNVYGSYQFPEKFIPLMITRALEEKPLPIYGDGLHVRCWLYVQALCDAIGRMLDRGIPGEIYNIGGQEKKNLDVAHSILDLLGKSKALIEHVKDRPGHDRRYAVDSHKIQSELGWMPAHSFDANLQQTVKWYQAEPAWWKRIKSGEYLQMYEKIYGSPP